MTYTPRSTRRIATVGALVAALLLGAETKTSPHKVRDTAPGSIDESCELPNLSDGRIDELVDRGYRVMFIKPYQVDGCEELKRQYPRAEVGVGSCGDKGECYIVATLKKPEAKPAYRRSLF